MVKPSEFKLLYVGEKGIHEENKRRKDGKISKAYKRLMIISHPRFGDVYIDYIHWDIDDMVEITVAERNTIPQFEPLKKIEFTSHKFNNHPFDNFFRLQYLHNEQKIDHTLQSLNNIVPDDIKKYFEQKNIRFFQKQIDQSEIAFFCLHSYYSYSDVLEIYLVSVFIPFINRIQALTLPKPKTVVEQKPSFNSFKEKLITYSFVAIILTGCFTCMTRKRIGAICGDGSTSNSTGSGACSHHGGVNRWKYEYWWDR